MKRDREYWDNRLSETVCELRHILTELEFFDQEQVDIDDAFTPSSASVYYLCQKLVDSNFLFRVGEDKHYRRLTVAGSLEIV